MKKLFTALAFCVVALFARPAKADCMPFETYYYIQMYTDSGASYIGYLCLNPDNSVATDNDYWFNLAVSYYGSYGSLPDEQDIMAYSLLIC